ncbi:glycosyltransferase [Patescibacteria group bacterium]|nr:glycosyltransferase [Patescibacteria group bacterium]
MKVAIVHELLTMRGGAERVLRILGDMFPDAPIYTLLYDEKKLGDWFPKERVKTSYLQNKIFPTPYALLPTPLRFNHHLYLPFFPKAVESWDFNDFNLVISTSSAFTHGIITNGKPKHLSYIHSPARYLWDRTHDVLDRADKGILGPIKRRYLERTFHKLRIWDSEAAARPDKLLAASKEVQRRIELYWRRDSEVVYPPIDDFWLTIKTQNPKPKTQSYFLIASTLVPYKQIDIAIDACNNGKRVLKIVGEGPDKKRLQNLAGPTVEFLGYVSHEDLKNLYANAKATIFPGLEDFGLVPPESMACGTPVVAFGKGGALETVTEETGVFFEEQTSDSLLEAIEKVEQKKFDPSTLHSQAQKFSRERFEEDIRKSIGEMNCR